MITFVPYPSFVQCACVLDRPRLGKQIIEAKEIYFILDGKKSPWSHHPAIGMWQQYPDALAFYVRCMVDEWRARGYVSHTYLPRHASREYPLPWWVGISEVHQSHRRNLTRKNKEWYSKFWIEQPLEGYLWPTATENIFKDMRRNLTWQRKQKSRQRAAAESADDVQG